MIIKYDVIRILAVASTRYHIYQLPKVSNMLILLDNNQRIFRLLLLILGITISGLAEAHKVNMFAYVDGNRVFIEGYFSDGSKAQNSEVAVYDQSGKQLLTGITGDDGTFSFKIPSKNGLRVTLNAGLGHRTEYTISADELASGVAQPATEAPDSSVSAEAIAEERAPATVERDGRDLDAVVRRAVGEAIKPLMRSVSELKARRGFSDIVGGIGFIFGILGVVFYLKARKLTHAGGERSGT
jgi:nickel transport protein